MGMKILKPGEEFSFPKDFGFSESAKGRDDARNHPASNKGHEAAARATERKGAGHPRGYADGGPTLPGRAPAAQGEPHLTMPAAQAERAAQALISVGRLHGANAAVRDLASAARSRPWAPSRPARSLSRQRRALSRSRLRFRRLNTPRRSKA